MDVICAHSLTHSFTYSRRIYSFTTYYTLTFTGTHACLLPHSHTQLHTFIHSYQLTLIHTFPLTNMLITHTHTDSHTFILIYTRAYSSDTHTQQNLIQSLTLTL